VTPLVIDAGAAVGILREERDGPRFAAVIASHAMQGGRVIVPGHFWLEVSNSLGRRHGWTGEAIVEAVHRLDTFNLETMALERPDVLLSITLMERHRLTAYDAAYLALAYVLQGSLLTGDRALAQAAGALAILAPGLSGTSETREPYLSDRETRPTWPDYSGLSAFLSKLRAEAIRDREAVRR